MFKFVVLALTVACANAAPGAVLASQYLAPVSSAVVTAHSSQVIARNYNGLAAPLVAAAPYIATPVAGYQVASPYVKAAAPLVAASALVKAAPLVAAPALAQYTAPFAHYHAVPFAQYHAAPAYYL